MPKKKMPDVQCSYCGIKSFYLYHKDKKTQKVDWAICLKCFKRLCTEILSNAKDGGRLKEDKDDGAPAVKCSYCEKIYQDEDKSDMGFESSDWAVCSACFRKVCDKVLGGEA